MRLQSTQNNIIISPIHTIDFYNAYACKRLSESLILMPMKPFFSPDSWRSPKCIANRTASMLGVSGLLLSSCSATSQSKANEAPTPSVRVPSTLPSYENCVTYPAALIINGPQPQETTISPDPPYTEAGYTIEATFSGELEIIQNYNNRSTEESRVVVSSIVNGPPETLYVRDPSGKAFAAELQGEDGNLQATYHICESLPPASTSSQTA